MAKWHKKGIIFNERHAQLPTPQILEDKIRIYYSSKLNNKSTIYYFDISEDFSKTTSNCDPVLIAGERGCFDDSGVMPSCIVDNKLYYTGWNCDKGQVPYGHGIGMAVWDGKTFQRQSKGPILDRNENDPFIVNSPFVLDDTMWYCRGIGWDGDFPKYSIAKAHYRCGKWISQEGTLIGNSEEAVSRVWVFNQQMWYGYKTKNTNYKIGYFKDKRIDDAAETLDVSENGWDSEMVSYPCVLDYKGKTYMFYNGNGYGATGIGYAIWE